MKRVNLLTLLFAVLIALTPSQALADIGGLTKCSESPAFAKRLKASVKKLEQRASQYEVDSPPALALKQQIDLKNTQVYACGSNDMINSAKALFFKNHLKENNFFSDAFVQTN
jgi:ferredoxin-NADP reductase